MSPGWRMPASSPGERRHNQPKAARTGARHDARCVPRPTPAPRPDVSSARPRLPAGLGDSGGSSLFERAFSRSSRGCSPRIFCPAPVRWPDSHRLSRRLAISLSRPPRLDRFSKSGMLASSSGGSRMHRRWRHALLAFCGSRRSRSLSSNPSGRSGFAGRDKPSK
jgi:hypothetical protein